jgi:2-polyprenyl-6-hydroxyphenyl methylase/3-demethylubiquinone-9 3-methyltransferase
MEGWARAAGLELQALTGMVYNPFSQQYSLGRDLDVNYLAHCIRPTAD